MTTIACNRVEMAGDSLITDDEIGIGAYFSPKVRRVKRSIFGDAGENCEEIGLAWEWLRSKRDLDSRPEFKEDVDFRLLELSPEGIFVWNCSLTRETVLEPNMALGSGRRVALYCMRELGMTPGQAVAEAAKVDHHTGGPITIMRLRSVKR